MMSGVSRRLGAGVPEYTQIQRDGVGVCGASAPADPRYYRNTPPTLAERVDNLVREQGWLEVWRELLRTQPPEEVGPVA